MLLHRWEVSVRINLPLFSTVVASNICMFLSCRPFVVITTLSTPTRPVDNVVITRGLQDRNIHILDGTTVKDKGKLILTEISMPRLKLSSLNISRCTHNNRNMLTLK